MRSSLFYCFLALFNQIKSYFCLNQKMRMKKYIYFIEMVLGGLMASCASVDVLTYDQLHPAEMSFPADIKQVGVVNNMPYRTAPLTESLTMGVITAEGKLTAEAVAGALADSKYFDQVIICDSALQPKDADITADPKLSAEDINNLSADLGVDMLVSLERLWVETSQKKIQYPGWNVPVSVVKSNINPVIRLYVPGRTQPLHTISISDSLYWDMGVPLSEDIILKEASKLAATKIAEYITPTWTQADRVYFSGGCVEMRDAAVYLREGDWKEAQSIWKGLYDRLRKGKTKTRAAFNIALSYEMLGDILSAEQWIQNTLKYVEPRSQEEQFANAYAKALEYRRKDVTNLNVQMSRFNDNF